MTILTCALILATMILAWIATGLVVRYAVSLGLLQPPNQRSFHSDPVPHGGGLGLVLAFCLAASVAGAFGLIEQDLLLSVLGCGGTLALLGLWDDIRQLRASTRLLVQGAAVLVALSLLIPPAANDIWWLLLVVISAFVLVWWVNLYNFMDGIDGLAAVECLCLCGSGLLLLQLNTGEGLAGQQLLLWLLGAASLGFLVKNWPPAKIFLGDVGSLFLGFTLGVLALGTVLQGQIPVLSWLILGGVFWVDSTLTLLRRILSAEPWYQAHRSHAYQRYAADLCRRYQSRGVSPHAARAQAHRATVLVVFFLNLLWLLPLAWLVIMKPDWSVLWILLAWLPLVILVTRSGKYG